jgi:predicted acyl esterase
MTSGISNKILRSKVVGVIRSILNIPAIHKKFSTANGEAAIAGIRLLLKLHHQPHPWDDLWLATAVEHPLRDEWWEKRNMLPLLEKVKIPVYLGCDWDNVTLHLPHTFPAFHLLKNSEHVRVAMMGKYGLTWPWESLHIEALAWFDHWLKGKDTGILNGPRFRYVLPGTDKWFASDSWPIANTTHHAYALNADSVLDENESANGERKMLTLGEGLNRPRASEIDPPSHLIWDSKPLENDLDIVGEIELQLDAITTAVDTAWIAILQEVGSDGEIIDVTAGFLRAGLREVDASQSRVGAPVLPCRNFKAIPVGEKVQYRIPLVPNARRFKAGSKIRLLISSDDQNKEIPALLEFRHASVGNSCLSKILSSSRLLLPVVSGLE